MRSIAILTANNDTFTNPTLITLFHILKKREVEVLLFGPQQQPSCPENLTNVKEYSSVLRLNLFRNPKYFLKHWSTYLWIFHYLFHKDIKTLLAVDPMGLIAGGRVKRILGKKIHLSYLSFEIFFKDELKGHYLHLKEKEIFYSKYIDSLLIQDEKRRDLLLNENHITLNSEKIALIPVSPMKIEILEKIDIRTKLNIPLNKKLVVYSGSVGEWCGTKAIIEAFDNGFWSNDYWLVFHTRKPIDSYNVFYEKLLRLDTDTNCPFTLHPHPFNGFEELAGFLTGFDLALALYYPNNENPYYGKNMLEIGLSSGKFAMYMMLGIPTIVTPCDIYNQLIKKFSFGAVLEDISQIGTVMSTTGFSKGGALDLYNTSLDPANRLALYLDQFE